jgi:hypothetical protein
VVTAGAESRLWLAPSEEEDEEDEAVAADRFDDAALLVVEPAEAPIDPVSAIRPKASAKAASAATATRLRILLIRCLRFSDIGGT